MFIAQRVGVGRRLRLDIGFVVGGTALGVEHDVAVLEPKDARLALADDGRAQDALVELPRAVDITNDQQGREHRSGLGLEIVGWFGAHRTSSLVGLSLWYRHYVNYMQLGTGALVELDGRPGGRARLSGAAGGQQDLPRNKLICSRFLFLL